MRGGQHGIGLNIHIEILARLPRLLVRLDQQVPVPLGDNRVRRRVQVSRVAGDQAVLATGPAVGSKIVTVGAAELFGTEVGFSK